MFQQGNKGQARTSYKRDDVSTRKLTVEDLLLSSDFGKVKLLDSAAPALGVARPKHISVGKTRELNEPINLSGHSTILGSRRVGIAMQDAKAGQEIPYAYEGDFWQEVDLGATAEGDTGSRATSALTSLNGKPAFYIPTTGKWTSVDPSGEGFEAGIFISDDAYLQPKSSGLAGPAIPYGLYYAKVRLTGKIAGSDVALPDAVEVLGETDWGAIYANPVADVHGLTVNFQANAASGNPEDEIKSIEWHFTNTSPYVKQAEGERVSYTFGSAAAQTVRVKITTESGKQKLYTVSPTTAATTGDNVALETNSYTLDLAARPATVLTIEFLNSATGLVQNVATFGTQPSPGFAFPVTMATGAEVTAMQTALNAWVEANDQNGSAAGATFATDGTGLTVTVTGVADLIPVRINGDPELKFTKD